MLEHIVGIDIGSSKIYGIVGSLDSQNLLHIMGTVSVDCVGLKKGIVVDVDDTSKTLKSCIDQLEKMVGISINYIYLSIPAGMCEVIHSKGSIAISTENYTITENDVERVIEASKSVTVPPEKEIIGIVPEQFKIDGYPNIKDPVGMQGHKLEVDSEVYISKTTIVNNFFKSVNRSGVKVKGIVLQSLAEAEAVLKNEERETGTALVDVGAETVNISLFKNGNLLYTDVLSLGGNSITNDISLCLKISISEAEKIKIRYANLNTLKDKVNESINIKIDSTYEGVNEVQYSVLLEIISARIEEILNLIHDKLLKSGINDDIKNVVIVGGGLATIKGICEFSQNILGRPVRIGAPEYVGASSPVYAASVGIVKNVVGSIKHFEDNSKESTKDILSNDKKDNDKSIVSKIKNFLADFF